MKKTFHAQSTLELIMVIILVLAGIFVMGPYVIRSVNAYMHSWELSVDQANSNPNVEVEAWEVPGSATPPPPPLDCSSFDDNSGDCEVNNGLLNCTWVTWYHDLGGGDCLTITNCANTENLEAGVDCQIGWNPGEECCESEGGSCPFCPH